MSLNRLWLETSEEIPEDKNLNERDVVKIKVFFPELDVDMLSRRLI